MIEIAHDAALRLQQTANFDLINCVNSYSTIHRRHRIFSLPPCLLSSFSSDPLQRPTILIYLLQPTSSRRLLPLWYCGAPLLILKTVLLTLLFLELLSPVLLF